jgi:phosphate transport system permease protein
MKHIDQNKVNQKMKTRLVVNKFYKGLFMLATMFGIAVLAILIYRILSQGLGYLSLDFLMNFPSRKPEASGISAALVGSLMLMMVVIPVSVLLGVGTAIYLEQYAAKNKFTNFIQTNIQNLAGVPSIVFGLLGLTIFVRYMSLGDSLLAGGLTMSLLILPIIVVASQEAIRSVPNSLSEASFGMGATKWQTIRRIVLPAAIPGIITGSILALSRAIGETAPLIIIGAATFAPFYPNSLLDQFTAMPIQIFGWVAKPQAEFQFVAAAGIIVLLFILLLMNSIAVFIRNKFQKRY